MKKIKILNGAKKKKSMNMKFIAILADEYVKTGRISSSCPLCGDGTLRTEGYIHRSRGSLTIICSKCGVIEHLDGLAEMHNNANPIKL